MQSIREIALEWAILHTADSELESPRLAAGAVELNDDLRAYFEDHVRVCLRSAQAQMGKFESPEGTVAAACERMISEGPDCCLDVSQAIGWWLHKQIGRQTAVTADAAICTFIDTETRKRYAAILKLDPLRMYLRSSEDPSGFEQILVLPDAAHGLATWAIVRTYDEETRYDVLYRAAKEDDYWAPDFLECQEIATPRQMTRLILSETGKWIDANTGTVSPEVASDLIRAVRETAQTHLLDLEELAERVIPNSVMRDDYIGRMLDKGLTQTRFEPDREWAERQSRKTTYVLDDGVTISGPSDAIDHVVQVLPKTDDGKTRLVIETKRFYQK